MALKGLETLGRKGMRTARGAVRLTLARARPDTRIGWPDERPDAVAAHLAAAGIPVGRWAIDVPGFHDYLAAAAYPETYHGGPDGRAPTFAEKALEHYVSLALANPRPDEVLVDVASNRGPFIGIARALSGCTTYEQDLQFPPGVSGQRIGGDAAHMPVPDAFCDVMTLHCSYDHFEGDADIGFAREAGRVLRPGGRVVIVPLYVSTDFGAKVDPRLRLQGLRLDAGMRRHYIPGLHVRFSRFYDARRLRERVLDPASSAGLDWEALRVEGVSDAVPEGYCNFALVLRKPG